MRTLIYFTPRELQVIRLVTKEYPIKRIAHEMGVKDSTVKMMQRNIRKKIGCQSLIGVTVYALKHKIVRV